MLSFKPEYTYSANLTKYLQTHIFLYCNHYDLKVVFFKVESLNLPHLLVLYLTYKSFLILVREDPHSLIELSPNFSPISQYEAYLIQLRQNLYRISSDAKWINRWLWPSVTFLVFNTKSQQTLTRKASLTIFKSNQVYSQIVLRKGNTFATQWAFNLPRDSFHIMINVIDETQILKINF